MFLVPLDVCRLTQGLHVDFQQLIGSHQQLNVEDGVLLPNRQEGGTDEV